jgi:hypothetical protein
VNYKLYKYNIMFRNFFLFIMLFLGTLSMSAQGNRDGQKFPPKGVKASELPKDSIKGKMNEEANRHELLNASGFQAPRQIMIGLPITDPGDFLVAENDIPVVYANMPQGPQSVWRPGDGAYANVYLMSLTETLLGYGRVGYGTNSYLQNGITPAFDPSNPGPPMAPKGFGGIFNYRTNTFNKQQFDLAISGPLGHNWYYAISTYQNIDPGYSKLAFNSMNNKLRIYRGSLTKVLDHNKGDISLTYRYAYTEDLFPVTSITPFIYNGSGKDLSHIGGLDWGTDFFGNPTGNVLYKNIKTGVTESRSFQDASKNYSHNLQMLLHYNFADDLKLKVSGRWNYVPKAEVPLQICTQTFDMQNTPTAPKFYTDATGATENKARYVQQWLSLFQHAFINDAMVRAEMTKTTETNKILVGTEDIFHYEDHDVSSAFYNTAIEKDGALLYTQMATGGSPTDVGNINPMAYNSSYLYNVAGSYYKGHEDRLALYAQDIWQVRPNLKIDGGFRLDYIDIGGKSLPYNYSPGFCMGGQATDVDGNPCTATLKPFSHTYWLPSFAAHINYNILKNFGLLGEFSYAKSGSGMNVYGASANMLPSKEQMKAQSVKFGRAGIFYNSPFVELVAVLTYIEKPKNLMSNNTFYKGAMVNILEQFGIRTIGATLDMMMHPFIKGLDFHFLFQYMNSQYKDFDITLNDNSFGGAASNPLGAGQSKTFSYSNNTTVGVPKLTIEMDPSYVFDEGKLRAWASFRYYSKTYGSIMNSVEFASHWETFAGIDWHVNRILSLGCNVENILNQSGLTGAVGGSEFMTKEEVNEQASKQGGFAMTGQYLRPFTVNFTASVKF